MAQDKTLDIEIIYEDADIVVVDKPAGVVVHRAPGHEDGSVAESLVRLFPEMAHVGSDERPGVVHRLDIDTSGVMVFAKNRRAYLSLRRQFESHEDVKKTYLAVVHGSPKSKSGTVDAPVGRDHLRAVTHWRLLGRHDGVSLMEFQIETGRMHQIRIHAAGMGLPIVGDGAYGSAEKDRRMHRRPARLLLHAVELSFVHPSTKRRVTFTAPPPPEIVYAG
ncbi:MAG: RluA family pseudouridine synthase [Kiritimatiellae bacterium]|nr:RluA family pseudouridine synthase [Kiritimatiellia bacterium]